MTVPCVAVATDFSARADRAIDRAKLLQRQMNGTLCVVHATNLPVDDTPDTAALDLKMRAATGLTGSEDRVSFAYPHGMPPHAIAAYCEKQDASVIVLGPARYNTLGDFFLGTAVDYVLRNTTRPVLVVKNRAHDAYRQIVAGTDFSPGSAHAILEAARLFPEASIHIVHAWQVPFQAFNKDAYVAEEMERQSNDQMAEFVSELASKQPALADATSEVVRGGTYDAIKKGLELDPSALVVLGSHGAGGFKQATIGSVTSDLLRLLETDTLVVNAKAAGS